MDIFIDFMKRFLIGAKKKIFLIVDGHPVHRSKMAKDFVASTSGKLEIFYG